MSKAKHVSITSAVNVPSLTPPRVLQTNDTATSTRRKFTAVLMCGVSLTIKRGPRMTSVWLVGPSLHAGVVLGRITSRRGAVAHAPGQC